VGGSHQREREIVLDLNFQGKVAVVTGGGSGIGASACHGFAKAGAPVAVIDVRAEPAQRVVNEIREFGGHAVALEADVADEPAIGAAIDQAANEFGRLDIVFANAGINGMQTPIEEMHIDEWHATIKTNLTGTFLTVKHAIPHLRNQGGGAIVITSSINGSRMFSKPGCACYSTSKAGQVAFAKMAAIELARWNIRVNTVLPGGVKTGIKERTYRRNQDKVDYGLTMPALYPPLMGKFATPDDVTGMVLFLASDASRHITGAEIIIDGAQSLMRG